MAREVDTSLPSLRGIRVLERLIADSGKPLAIRTDNGPGFISRQLQMWCEKNTIRMQHIQPGKPMQNGYIERKNGSLRKELLDAYLFYSLAEVKAMSEEWRTDYNHQRPHSALG